MAESFSLPPGTAEMLARGDGGDGWGKGSATFICPVCGISKAVAVPVGPEDTWGQFYREWLDSHIEWHFQKIEGRA